MSQRTRKIGQRARSVADVTGSLLNARTKASRGCVWSVVRKNRFVCASASTVS